MEFQTKILLLALLAFWLYGIISDSIKDSNFEWTMKRIFGNFSKNNYTHSLIEFASKAGNAFSAFTATIFTTTIYFVPVKQFFVQID